MHIGFTGTQYGMNKTQSTVLKHLLDKMRGEDRHTFHHGDCVGADAEAHDIAHELGFIIDIHPPLDEKKRAWCGATGLLHNPSPYLNRNHTIVTISDVMFAAPLGMEQLRSGTWATIRYAKRLNRTLTVINRDGTIS